MSARLAFPRTVFRARPGDRLARHRWSTCPDQRQSISPASAVSAKGAFWFATYHGALNGESFVELLKKLMHRRKKPLRLVLDGLPAHKTKAVKTYVVSWPRSLPKSATIPNWCARSSGIRVSPIFLTFE